MGRATQALEYSSQLIDQCRQNQRMDVESALPNTAYFIFVAVIKLLSTVTAVVTPSLAIANRVGLCNIYNVS